MPSREQTQLRVYSSGGWPVSETIEFLQVLKSTYDRLLVFEILMDDYQSRERRLRRYMPFPEAVAFFGGASAMLSASELSDASLVRFIAPHDELVLQSVQLSSPGSWQFVGSVFPLEVIRKMINDHHTRRQDREYREGYERRRLEIENLILETEFMRGRISMARELGATDAELTPLLNALVYEPLARLDAVAAKGMIRAASETEEGQES